VPRLGRVAAAPTSPAIVRSYALGGRRAPFASHEECGGERNGDRDDAEGSVPATIARIGCTMRGYRGRSLLFGRNIEPTGSTARSADMAVVAL
jgi:hypothetical protein